jgi:NAD+ kinase
MTTRRRRPPRVCVVLKRSSWRKWVEEEADPRIARLLAANDETVHRMRRSHRDHVETIEEVRVALHALGVDAKWSDRAHTFRVAGRCDLVVTVGGDGTLLAASHGIGSRVPLLGVNSSPPHSVGFFCGAKKGGVRAAIEAALGGKLRRTELTRMRVELDRRVLHRRVLNEALFCHAVPAATSRYILRVLGDRGRVIGEEEQKSSGVWVGPAAGSTAAQQSAGGRILPLPSRKLQYVVREPYRPRGESLRMTLGLFGEGKRLALKSKMRQARVFLDGDHIVFNVTIGEVVTMRRSDEPLVVLGLSRNGAA